MSQTTLDVRGVGEFGRGTEAAELRVKGALERGTRGLQRGVVQGLLCGGGLCRQCAECSAELRRVRCNLVLLLSVIVGDALQQVVFCPLEETHDEALRPRAAVLWDAARREGVLRVEKLPPPGAGKDYQLWAVEAGHQDTVNAGVVSLGEGGSVEERFAPVAAGGKDRVLAFAISVERAGGSPKNEGPVVFLGKL